MFKGIYEWFQHTTPKPEKEELITSPTPTSLPQLPGTFYLESMKDPSNEPI